MKVKTPEWRQGQTVFNFLEWLRREKGVPADENARMADPFYVSDENWEKWFEEFLSQSDHLESR